MWLRYRALRQRAGRLERRELRELRRWIEHTSNLVHLSVLLFVPLLVGVVTWLSGAIPELSFLLFPPLASGTYTLFSDPQGRHSSPWRFVGGLTTGALCGWAALELAALFVYHVPPDQYRAAPGGAALGVLLTAIATWLLDVEEPSAFSTALLVLITNTTRFEYVLTVVLSSTIVAAVFVGWRELVYERRAKYLYQSINGDDHVLVPVRGETTETTAMFAARLAAAHSAGRVVLFDTVSADSIDDAEAYLRDNPDSGAKAALAAGEDLGAVAEHAVTEHRLKRLAGLERHIETELDVSCEITITAEESSPASATLRAAGETGCDLVVAPYEETERGLSSYVRELFAGDVDAIALRAGDGRTSWNRVLVPVRRAGDVANSMLDFAQRLTDGDGWVSVCSCIDSGEERRTAERMLADLVETVGCACEIHVARADIEEYLAERAPHYDLVVMGASTDRSAASRLVSPPTFKRLRDIDCDVAIVHKG